MRDYISELPAEAPKGLMKWALEDGALDTGGLTYEVAWVMDDSPDAILEERCQKVKMVRCHCSECDRTFLADWASVNPGYSGRKVTYGFQYMTAECYGDVVSDGDSILCPICHSPVSVRHAPSLGDREFTTSECLVSAVSLMKGKEGERPLVITEYHLRRRVNRFGAERFEALPEDSWVFDGDKCFKFRRWKKSYSGSVGYFMVWTDEWRRCKDLEYESGSVCEIYGLTKKKLEASSMHNARFWEYMKILGAKYPVPYLRLYQTHHHVENLMSAGVGRIVNELIAGEVNLSSWKKNTQAIPQLTRIDWSQLRPAQMLHLNKEELGWMQEQCWSRYHWELFVAAKKSGDRLTPDDIYNCHCYGGEDLEELVGLAPLGKSVRYLLKQYGAVGEMAAWDIDAEDEDYNPYADPYVDDGYPSATLLADYWVMAGDLGWNLNDPAIRWPKHLVLAHERAMEGSKQAGKAEQSILFRKRFVELSSYIYMSGDLMIVPADSQKSLDMEGDTLHHCVESYGDDHARAKTAIFFIRHTWAPGKSYFTLEYDEKKEEVKQNRGRYNCVRTSEVKAFEREWLDWIHNGRPRDREGLPIGARPVVDTPPEAQIILIEKETNAA